ncbi:MAG: IS630 transposase-related protein, partial [Alphaproteobacteria bacterium]
KRTSFHQKMDVEQLKAYVSANPDHTLKEIGKALNMAYQTVFTWVVRLSLTRKKRPRVTRNATKKRVLFSKQSSKN